MRTALPSWLRADGRLGRRSYFLWGAALFAIKHNLDRVLGSRLFGERWELWSYVAPLRSVPSGWESHRFYAFLLLISLPFIAAGVLLTVRRLRDADLPLWLVALVFLPFVKFLFFALLSLVPSREERIVSPRWPTRRNPWLPSSSLGSALLSILVTAILALALIGFGTHFLGTYGWSLFVGIPFLLGLSSVLIASRSRPLERGEALGLANLSVFVCGVLLVAFAFEGVICLAMAIPIAVPLASLGGYVGYVVQRRRGEALEPTHIGGLFLLFPLLMSGEKASLPDAPVYAVTTRVEVAADPDVVWKNVVEFSELRPPEEWLFRAGIAYPMRARIVGRGPGATRYCEFSTGPFIEPIQTWDEPRLLKFSVTENPAPMEEWTPYRHIEPPHLRRFLVSQAGQFRLTPVAGGRTLLEGTTWYRHSLWPAAYWKRWSDFIIHRIHRRVLDHIRRQAEGAA